MNTCKCNDCLGKNCHYSNYYHREEGFDTYHNNFIASFQERILSLENEINQLRKAVAFKVIKGMK